MFFLVIIFVPIILVALLALIVTSMIKAPETTKQVIYEQGKKGTRSVLHHNSSYKVSDCMEVAKATLEEYNLKVDCAKFSQNY